MKNTAYYKAAFAKSEAASPYNLNKTPMRAMKEDSSMKAMDKTSMKAMDKTSMKAMDKTSMKAMGESHMKGTMEEHRAHHKAEHGAKRVPGKKPGSYIGPGDFQMMD